MTHIYYNDYEKNYGPPLDEMKREVAAFKKQLEQRELNSNTLFKENGSRDTHIVLQKIQDVLEGKATEKDLESTIANHRAYNRTNHKPTNKKINEYVEYTREIAPHIPRSEKPKAPELPPRRSGPK